MPWWRCKAIHTRIPGRGRGAYLVGGLMLLFAAGATVQAQDIYKWVDEHGQVHYGDAPGGDGARAVTVRPAPPADPELSQRREQQDKLLQSFDAQRAQEEKQAVEAEQKEKIRQQRCIQARTDLDNYTRFPRLFEFDAQGRKHYLDEATRQRLIDSARAAVERWCS